MKKRDILENQAKIVYLGIGSNLGDRKKNIEIAKSHLSENNLDFLSVSSFYETPSWPDPQNPKFLNIVIKAKFNFDPETLLKICKNIEILLGRTTKKNPVGAFKTLTNSSFWKYVGALGVLASFTILSFYSVVGGWSLAYTYEALVGTFKYS